MNYIKQNHLSLLIIFWLIVSGFLFKQPVVDVDDMFAAINREPTTITNPFIFQQGITNQTTLTQTGVATFAASPVFTSGIDKLIQGGGVLATTTASITATSTLALADLRDYNYFEVVNMSTNVSGITAWAGYTLPATSTMISLLPTIGDSRTWIFHNATSTSLSLGFAAGAGMDLVSSTAGSDWVTVGEWAKITCMQITYRNADNENIMCEISKFANED